MAIDDTAYPQREDLTAIAIAYKNPDASLIADGVFPRSTVGEEKFTWSKYDDERGFTVPDTTVDPYGKVPQLKLHGSEQSSKVKDRGLDIPLSQSDLKNPDAEEHATMQSTNLMLLDREQRAANLAFDAAQYPTGFKKTLSGSDQFSHADSDPIKEILLGFDKAWMRPNVLAIGHPVWSVLRVHPKVVSAALGNDGQYGVVTRQRLAELLEVDEVLVGSAWVNSVKPGKTPVLMRLWGKHALGFFRDRTVTTRGGLTFGLTAQMGTRVAGSRPAPELGVRGGRYVRAAEFVEEVVIAPRAAYFFEDAVA